MKNLIIGTEEYDEAVKEFERVGKELERQIHENEKKLSVLCKEFFSKLECPNEYWGWTPTVGGYSYGVDEYGDCRWISSSEGC